MQINKISPTEISNMSYNEIIGLVRETNRPPGGTRTIAAIAKACFLGNGRKVLEIGTSTGITALELAQLTGCQITAIDINEESLKEASERAKNGGVSSLIKFLKDDATNLSFEDNTFDVVFCGNVTSLVSNRDEALKEYARVLKPGGILAAVPMYYIKKPSIQLVKDVSKAIKVEIEPHTKEYWIDFFSKSDFNILSCDDFSFDNISPKEVEVFCDNILSRSHLNDLSVGSKEALSRVYYDYMELFRVNLSHMGYSVLTLVKTDPLIDRELFTASIV